MLEPTQTIHRLSLFDNAKPVVALLHCLFLILLLFSLMKWEYTYICSEFSKILCCDYRREMLKIKTICTPSVL